MSHLVPHRQTSWRRSGAASVASRSIGLVATLWLLVGFVLYSPLASEFSDKLYVLVPPVATAFLLLLVNPRLGFTFWAVLLGYFVSQTGFQIDVGPVRISALEIIVLVLLLATAWFKRRDVCLQTVDLRIPGSRCLALFALYATAMLLVGILRGVSLATAISEFKGFMLYPLMAYVMVVGLRTRQSVAWAVGVATVCYVLVAGAGMLQFYQGDGILTTPFRASADYAPVNLFGITLLSMSFFMLGIGSEEKSLPKRLVLLGICMWFFGGAVCSVSRSVWIAAIGGVLFSMAAVKRRSHILIFLGLVALVWFGLPEIARARVLNLTDTSFLRRQYYLTSGLEAWKEKWLFGWGWGHAFWLDPRVGLRATESLPWYHNDYLNLGVQTGIVGVVLYLGYWAKAIGASFKWTKVRPGSGASGLVRGAASALVVLLVAAAFEHVLWRPDIGGLLGWYSGILLVAMKLEPARVE